MYMCDRISINNINVSCIIIIHVHVHVGKPHNPMINSGALVLSSLIKPHLSLHERMIFVSFILSLLSFNNQYSCSFSLSSFSC